MSIPSRPGLGYGGWGEDLRYEGRSQKTEARDQNKTITILYSVFCLLTSFLVLFYFLFRFLILHQIIQLAGKQVKFVGGYFIYPA